jgi:hypothetical protein
MPSSASEIAGGTSVLQNVVMRLKPPYVMIGMMPAAIRPNVSVQVRNALCT